jgi:hypothetical protein
MRVAVPEAGYQKMAVTKFLQKQHISTHNEP